MDLKTFFKKNMIHIAVLISFAIAMYAYFSLQFNDHGLKQHDIKMYKGMSNEIVHHREVTGEDPLWTNSMFGGMPATQISVEHKGNVFRSITKFLRQNIPAPAGIFFLHLIAFYIMGLLLRIKPMIAALGAFAFAFASYEMIIIQAGHNTKAMAVAFAPPVIGAFVMAYRRNWKWGAVFSMIFMGFQIAQNHLQVTYYLLFLLFGLGVFELVQMIRNKSEENKVKFKKFGITTAAVLGGYAIALFVNFGNIKMTNDYAKHTIRGKNEIAIKPDGTTNTESSAGLDKDYITNWSYGKGESFTLISPYVKGSHSATIRDSYFEDWVINSDRSEEEKDLLIARDRENPDRENNRPMYFGEQSITSGPVYIGVVVGFLAVLGLVLLNSPVKWVYFGVSVLALLLSWGKNFEGLTDFFIDYFPMYNKFRTVTIILVLIELCLPILGILVLQQLWEEREQIKEKRKVFLITSGAFIGFLILMRLVGVNSSYATQDEVKQMKNLPSEEEYAKDIRAQLETIPAGQLKSSYGVDKNNPVEMQRFVDKQLEPLKNIRDQFNATQSFRLEMEKSSWNRSILFGLLAAGVVALFFYTSIPSPVIIGGLILVVLMDMIPVDRVYLGDRSFETPNGTVYLHWDTAGNTEYPYEANGADEMVLQNEVRSNAKVREAVKKGENLGKQVADETNYDDSTKQRIIDSYRFQALNAATNYRVFEPSGGFGSSRASYFHKSIGGYHGAKLQSIQNLFDFQLSKKDPKTERISYTMNPWILDMLNIKYILTRGQRTLPNGQKQEVDMAQDRTTQGYKPLGNAWLVKNVLTYETPADELNHLGASISFENVGQGKLMVNGKEIKKADLFLSQNPSYILGKDTFNINLDWKISEVPASYFVINDSTKQTEIYPDFEFAKDSLRPLSKLVVMNTLHRFRPAQQATMLKSQAAKLKKKEFTGEGEIKMLSYAPNKIVYEANLKGDQLAVFSEIYYEDGWKASVDGVEQDILRVDYLLRGLELKGGKHKIEFTYDIPAFHRSNTMAFIGSTIVFLIIGGMLFMDWKAMRSNQKES